MGGMSRRAVRARMRKGLRLLEEGLTTREVAERLGVAPQTVRKWRREGVKPTPRRRRKAKRSAPRAAAPKDAKAPVPALAEMLQAELPEIARVLLEMAKGGDVRAATLVMKLTGTDANSIEKEREQDAEAGLRELERGLRSLPPEIAATMVELLAEAEAEAERRTGGTRPEMDGAGRGPVRLPWQKEDRTPD